MSRTPAARQFRSVSRCGTRRLYILDANLKPTPLGIPGELHIGGRQLARGYLKRPELTKEKFIPDPFSKEPGARLYKTGDLAKYLPDGNIEYLGRLDFQVKLRGFRIELGEIESALKQHPGVKEAVVVAREDEPGDKRLVAYVVPGDLNIANLRKSLAAELPDYMVPSAFVGLDALPLSSNGKLDRRALPKPDRSASDDQHADIAPRTPTEDLLATIWCEVLHLDRVGVESNFFDLGGHSLLATRVVARVRKAFQVELPLRDLFETPTIAALAKRLEALQRQERGATAPPIVRANRDEPIPLSYAQQRLWFIDQLDPGNPLYNIPKMVRLRGDLNVGALEEAINVIVQRHEVLRTTFSVHNGEPVQIIQPSLRFAITPQMVSGEEEMWRVAHTEAAQPFDLRKGPLLRALLLRLAANDHVLIFNMHHVVTERWSQGLFWNELGTLYRRFSGLPAGTLPELTIQYADYAVWQRRHLAGTAMQQQIEYWKHNLAGAPALLELPTDRPRPAVAKHRGATMAQELPNELVESLRKLSRTENVTLFMTLLAAFQTLLARYSRQDDIVVGTTIAGRNDAELEHLLGFFVNTLALRTDLSGDPQVRELLARVREVALNAYAHQDIPFEKLVEELNPARNLSYQPIFQVGFVQDQAIGSLEMPGLALEGLLLHQGTAIFDLCWFVVEKIDGVRLFVEYDADLFAPHTIERMLGHFQTLLEAIAKSPASKLSELPLLSEEEEQQLAGWNNTARDYPQDVALHQFFERQAARVPDATALVCNGERFSYRELNARANQVAHYLRARGAGPDVLVGICTPRTPEMLIGILGILKSGSAYVPIDPVVSGRAHWLHSGRRTGTAGAHARTAARHAAEVRRPGDLS